MSKTHKREGKNLRHKFSSYSKLNTHNRDSRYICPCCVHVTNGASPAFRKFKIMSRRYIRHTLNKAVLCE